jgi:hypothetical protein
LQSNDLFDIPYNFLISSVGESYEVRGWEHESGFTNHSINNESVSVALIGNYTVNQLEHTQLAEIEALISEAIRRRQLQKDYNIYGVHNESFMLYRKLKTQKQWVGIV